MSDYHRWRDFCERSYNSSADHRSHVNFFLGIFHCDHPQCHQILSGSYEHSREEILKNHQLRAHFRCPLQNCGETLFGHDMLTEAEALRIHYRSAHFSTYCFECNANFERDMDLRTHKNDSHPSCSLCRKIFRSKSDEDAHYDSFHGQNTYCETCGQRNDNDHECVCRKSETHQKSKKKESFSQPTSNNTDSRGGSHYKDNDEQDEHFKKHFPKEKSKADTRQTVSEPTDFYTLLGISSDASDNEIAKAAKKARITYHPDRYIGKNISPEEVTKIGELSKFVGQAADVLLNSREKAKYDAKLRTERISTQHGPVTTAAPKPSKPKPEPSMRTKKPEEPRGSGNRSSRYERDGREWPGTPPRKPPKEQSWTRGSSFSPDRDPFSNGRTANEKPVFPGGNPYNPQDRPLRQEFNNSTNDSAAGWQSGSSQSNFQTSQAPGKSNTQDQPGTFTHSRQPFSTCSTKPFAYPSQWSSGGAQYSHQAVPWSSTAPFGKLSPKPVFQPLTGYEGLTPEQARQKSRLDAGRWSSNVNQLFTGMWGQSPITSTWNQDTKSAGVDEDGDVMMADV